MRRAVSSARLQSLGTPGGLFADGVVKYTSTVGTDEAQAAFKNIIGSTGAATDGLHCVVTDGGSQAMSLMVLGVCGPRAMGRFVLSPLPVAVRGHVYSDPSQTAYM